MSEETTVFRDIGNRRSNTPPPKVTAVILAGGASERMGGRNKALLDFEGHPLIEHQIQVLRSTCDEVLISANSPEPFRYLGVPIVPDAFSLRGALVGIYSGLLAARHPFVFVVACDMPFLNSRLITFMRNVAAGWDIVIPETARGLEPLHALYSRRCAEPIKRQLLHENMRIIDFFQYVRVRRLTTSEMAALDPSGLALTNINTPEEYNEVVRHTKSA